MSENRKPRDEKRGPVGFAAPETAKLLQKDGPRGDLITKVTTTYSQLKQTLAEWKTFGVWIIVYPIENGGEQAVMDDIVKLAKRHLEEGGRIVTAWSPITAQTKDGWMSMVELWKTLDATFSRFATADQMFSTASNVFIEGKLFVEVGAPESSAHYFRAYPGVAAAKQLYECIRRCVPQIKLPELVDRSMRPSTQERGGVSCGEAEMKPPQRVPLKRRAL